MPRSFLFRDHASSPWTVPPWDAERLGAWADVPDDADLVARELCARVPAH